MTDLYWVVDSDERWPTFDIDPAQLEEMLADWDAYWPGAVASLANAGDGSAS